MTKRLLIVILEIQGYLPSFLVLPGDPFLLGILDIQVRPSHPGGQMVQADLEVPKDRNMYHNAKTDNGFFFFYSYIEMQTLKLKSFKCF